MLAENKSAASLPPPPYAPPTPHMPPSALPAQNHLHIHKSSSAIVGSYLIDVSLPGGEGKNLSLSSDSGAVHATVYLKGEGKRADVEAISRSGQVGLEIRHCPASLPLHLLASTRSGAVTAALPEHFEGPLTIHVRSGSVTILPSLERKLRIIEDGPMEKRYWVGKYSWDGEEKSWVGDQCMLETRSGSVTVGLSDEYMKLGLEETDEDEGWFCGMPWCK